jgi:hypothetical protein
MLERISTLILHEASKSDQKIMDEIERDQVATDFQDTLAGLETISSMSFPAESVPIMKDECGECGECGEGCNENYMVDYDILYKFCESNDYEDEVEAHAALCEHYGFESSQLVVVAECDAVNKGLLDNIGSGQLGVARRYCCGLCNLLNHGIRVVKTQ